MRNNTLNLPRVTYTNAAGDYSSLHALLDAELPRHRASLGGGYPSRIGGADDWDGVRYEVRSPFDDRILLGAFLEPSPAAVTRAVAAARNAVTQWGRLAWRERLALMRKFARVVDEQKYELAMAALYECGKTRMEALSESEEAVSLIEYYCDQLEENKGFAHDPAGSSSAETAQVSLRPYGVFAVISPFNYPVALVTNMVAAALIAGNTVVLKASPNSGLTASMFVKLAEQAGLPQGTLNFLCGTQAGQRLVSAPGVDGIAFTGSYLTGMKIVREVAKGTFMRPVIGELGGKNHAYVAASANLSEAVEGVAKSAFAYQGQKCSACSVVFVHSSLKDQFVSALVERTKSFKIGNVENRDVNIGALNNAASVTRYLEAVQHGVSAGRLVYGGNRLQGGDYDHGNFVEPAIFVDLPENDRLLTEELFAPILSVRTFDDINEALSSANALPFGLTAGLYSRNPEEISFFIDNVQAGILYINRASGATTGAWPGIQSFCGWKGSGLTGKGGLGPHYLPQFFREQCITRRIV